MNTNKAYFYSNTQTQTKFEIGEFSLIGSGTECQIRLNGSSVAERHARVEYRNQQYWLRDMRSGQPTFINQTQIQEALLKEGDLVEMGDQCLVFTLEEQIKKTTGLRSKNTFWQSELDNLYNISQTDFPVLLLGQSGTGKEVLAENIHENSQRSRGPFIRVNCSALTETLVESELFGHVKGSFTGAIDNRKGAFEAARGGTLFLDEIGDLPYAIQAKLLRALENNEIRPVGSDRTVETDVRVIAATHQNLNQKISEDKFRTDLYYRLNVVSITTPTLLQRMEDFDDILYSFAKKFKVRFSFASIQTLKEHYWPGNIRELRNTVARAAAYFPKQEILAKHVEKILDNNVKAPVTFRLADLASIKSAEKQMIIEKLTVHFGNQRKAALELGIPKSTLHDRLKAYEINPREYMRPFQRPAMAHQPPQLAMV